MVPRPQQRTGTSTLRVGSHNVNGFSGPGRAAEAGRLWRQLGLDVVMVQETHLCQESVDKAATALRASGYTALWSHHTSRSAGVGLVVRQRLIGSGELTIDEAGTQHLEPGRVLLVRAQWGGHRLALTSIYLPTGMANEQRRIISTHLAPILELQGVQQLWGGDFNFVVDATLDRMCPGGRAPPNAGSEPATARLWAQEIHQLRDVYRCIHPTRRAYTFVCSRAASRIDRMYASASLATEYVAACRVARHVLGPRPSLSHGTVLQQKVSDHRPVTLDMLAILPSARGPGLPRLRLDFLTDATRLEQLRSWVELQAHMAPQSHVGILAWWPEFKVALATQCAAQWRAHRSAAEPRALVLARTKLSQLYEALDTGVDVALATILAAQQAWAEAAAACHTARRQRERQDWVHSGERPSPALTQMLRPPKAVCLVPALRGPDGLLVTEQPGLARLVARTWAHVSRVPQTDPAATARVLEGLVGSPHVPPDARDALGSSAITPSAVHMALKTSPGGRAPGLDGIPTLLYRKLGAVFSPLLARLYSAIGELKLTPAGFLDGAISVLHKKGDRADPSNYRPITLLNTDYRLLAKVLASRLQRVLPMVIDPAQLAFVRGRQMGEAVLLMQALPAWLLQQPGRGAVAVLCDFAKAFDTVDRSFLLTVLERLEIGPGFRAWVATLLRHTRACAVVNGFRSGFETFHAGVRQGCPLSPLLYLFVGQAMLQWWRAKGVGILGPPRHPSLVGVLFADDATALLGGLDDVPAFLQTMNVFGAASNQHLERTKVQILLLGAPAVESPNLPLTAHGLGVVTSTMLLGVPIGTKAQTTASDWWTACTVRVHKAYSRIAAAKLSIFGRAMAAAAYGISQLLHCAELSDLPPPRAIKELTKSTAKLVDRGRPPEDTTRTFTGMAYALLPGSPKAGGFGAMPWREHIIARHATWAARLAIAFLSSGPCPPWAAVMAALHQGANLSPHCHPMWLFTHPKEAGQRGNSAGLVGPLHATPMGRLLTAAQSLPPLEDVGLGGLAPGPWCGGMPLWGNPLLMQDGIGLEHNFPGLTHLPCLATLGDLLRLAANPGQLESAAPGSSRPRTGPPRAASHAVRQLAQLRDAIPAPWKEAAQAAAEAGHVATTAAAWAEMLPHLGWRGEHGKVMLLQRLRVRDATQLLCMGSEGPPAQRRLKHAAFAELAGEPNGSEAVLLTLRRLWHTPVLGRTKEPYWRLVYDGIPTAARMHMGHQTCPCGAAPADRAHHFWSCLVAGAVRSTVLRAAASAGRPLQSLRRGHLWLARPPQGINQGVWDVVALAAVAAMEKGRAFMVAEHLYASPPIPAGPALAARGGSRARIVFWELLHEFAAMGVLPKGGRHGPPVDETHPFLCLVSPGAGTVRVHQPAAEDPTISAAHAY